MDGIVRSIIEEGVKVVETAGRNPEKYVKMFKDAGVVVIHKCTSIRHALTAQRVGADMISMDGFDCGGKIPPLQLSDMSSHQTEPVQRVALNSAPCSPENCTI